ncbi:hypothetical protein L6164_023383 [Bauhinia variegata]|uniref:Uncharacterized protein n=1 Tax=Bauhinia variegata TaxID=167791 RepID=A0ACB9MI15_BAUVA|nr:hypothetical protein L6164_023383 [Bauhinia variegata]
MAGGAARDVSFSISEFKYHVCLSYSGSDTEKGFVSNLDAALKRAGLTTYKYEEIPDKRNDKKEILMQIARSLSIILIISENYASSPWYLDEMKWILECRLNSHILLLPVYYHQRRSIAKAFGKLVQGFGNDKLVKNWRYVLERVGKLGGWQYGERPESVLIPEIISILRGWLASTCRSRRGKPLSDLLVEILVNLASPGITDFLAKHVVLDRIKSLLITLGDKVKSIENKTFTNEEWSDHLENISQLLDKMTGCIDLGQEKGAEARVNVILKELEIMMEVAEPFLLEEKIFLYCGVDQSDVRNVSGSFGKAFARFVDNSAHDEDKVLRWMFAMRAVGNLSGLHSGGRSESVLIEEIVSKVRGQLIEMSRSRRGKSLSDFHFEILAKLVSPAITDFLAKCLELDNIKQSLVTLAGKVTGKNMKTFTPESSVEKWSDRLENVSYLLDKAIGHIYLGREKDAEAQVNNILKELETMMEYPDPFVHEQTIGKKKIIISFLQSYELRGSNNASVTVIVGSGKSRTFLADNVYRDATVMDSFDISGWVKFEDKLDALSLTKCILESLNANFCDGDDLQKLMAQLHECLSGWKSMLVFDGFDSFQNWEILVKCIEAAERGSSIVLTASKADIIEIGDCIVFTDQNVVSVSEAVHVDLNSSDLPDNEFVWKTLHRTSSHYLKKQPNMIVKEEVHEIAADELIEGLAYASEPQSLPTNANLATKSGDDSEADHQEASAVEIEDVVDDQTETSSDQDTLDFLSFVTINVSDVSQLRELPQRLHSLRIVECHFLESLAAELKSESLNLSELYMIDCGSLKDFVDESYLIAQEDLLYQEMGLYEAHFQSLQIAGESIVADR